MQAEVRTLEFWRSIIAECLATFFYVLLVCSATTSASEHRLQTDSALAAGFGMAAVGGAFAGVSGAHANPAVTVACLLARHLSPLRAVLYVCAQCGGGVAGAALVLGVYSRISDPAVLQPSGGTFAMEFALTTLIMYTFCASRASRASPLTAQNLQVPVNAYGQPTTTTNTYGQTTNNTFGGPTNVNAYGQSGAANANAYGTNVNPYGTNNAYGTQHNYYGADYPQSTSNSLNTVRPDITMVAAVYASCLLAWKGSLNPARALGAAFVSKDDDRFSQHWMFWVGPILGAITGAFAHEYVFNQRRRPPLPLTSSYNTATGGYGYMTENASLRSDYGMGVHHHVDDLEMLDDLERAKQYKANITQEFDAYGNAVVNRNVPMGSKSMYNGSNTGGVYDSYGAGSKSLYNEYGGNVRGPQAATGAASTSVTSLRRSRTVMDQDLRSKVPPRRNPYDYLPDEPDDRMMVNNRPDIVDSNATPGSVSNRPVMGGAKASGAAGNGRYGSRDPLQGSDLGYGKGNPRILADDYDTYKQRLRHPSEQPAAQDKYGEFGRMPPSSSRMRNDYYSPQYTSASYSAQNGISIEKTGANYDANY